MEDDTSLPPEEELAGAQHLDHKHEGSLTSGGRLVESELEAEAFLQDVESSASLECCPQKEQTADAVKTTVRGRVQALHLRRDLNYLDMVHEEKDFFIQKTRGELRACRQRIDLITRQQKALTAEIDQEKEANNMATVGRLQAVYGRLCKELESEKALESSITSTLKESKNALWHIEILEGRLDADRKALEEEEAVTERHLQAQAAQRLQEEKAAFRKSERNRLLRIQKSLHIQKEHGLRHQKLVEDAQKNHRIAVKFLKASLSRVREQEHKEEMESRERLKRRMDAVLALKNNITANRETLRKFQAWTQARAEGAAQKAQVEKEAILAQGGDAFKQLFHQRRRQELEAQKRAFEEEQKQKRLEIVTRLCKEAKEEDKRRKQLPPTQTSSRLTLRDKTWCYVANFLEGQETTDPVLDAEYLAHPNASQLLEDISSESVQADSLGLTNLEETLAEPEIPGLWNKDYKPYQVPREDMERKPIGGTKMDKDILAHTMERLQSGLVQKQVASGREFKGRPFNSKPELIHFKDFDVGKVYKKKITLINATYTINYCKLVGVEEHLKDFIHIDFNPPGPMSAGMSCEVLVTFKPMIDKDLEGNISFLAQTGGFSVPLKCSTKKCSLSLDKSLIDFGSYVVGETASRVITLTNTGGLGTAFKFYSISESCELATSVKTSSILTYGEKNLDEKVVVPGIYESNFRTLRPSPIETMKTENEDLEKLCADSERITMTTITEGKEEMEIHLGEETEGEIGPFSSIKVPIIFTPVIPGEVQVKFKVIFKNPHCPPLYFSAVGVAMDVPVWVPKPNVDLKICMYDRLYQDSVLVRTRSKAALRLRFEVCRELRGHIELLPETGYIQALSSYSVQLKFLPRLSLPEDAKKYFDKETRVLEAPMTIWVADQTRPVEFIVHAIVTTSDLEISPSEVDFGYCTVYEGIKTEITLHNHSLLPQEFGFVGLPKFVDIQPNDGFGTVLPLESLKLDVIFQPTKAKEYSFDLICKSVINRQFKLSCRAVGVQPPLELSHHLIKFSATALYDTSLATLYVINSHLNKNSRTPSMPHAGSQDDTPVGPKSFEFLLPPDSPITISPLVGTVLPGKRCLVQVAFQPVLPEELVRQEALQALSKEAESKASRKDIVTQKKDLRKSSIAPMRRQYHVPTPSSPDLQKQELKTSSEEFQVAQAALARTFSGKFDKFVVPCVVANGDIKDRRETEPMSFSPHNTLYLELWCPAVAPSLIVTSDKGKTIINFGEVAVGQRSIKKITIQNTCPEDLAVEFSVLNPIGPFVLLNPFSKVLAGKTQTLGLSFLPQESTLTQETMDLITKRSTLTLTLLGTGVTSMIVCSIKGDVFNMGYVLAGESLSSTFQLENQSTLPIKFSMRLDSLSSKRMESRQQLPQYLVSPAHRTEVVGTQNLNGQSVFSVIPVEGVIDPGKAQDFTVTFSPDHESLYFSDQLQVVLFDKTVSHRILLKGAAREHMMFVEGGDPLDVPVESLTVTPTLDLERREEIEEGKSILVTLEYLQLDTSTPAPPATRELQVGCIRTSQLTSKKSVEFNLDITALQHKGFTVEPSRGFVERGQTKTISISWMPTADFDPDHPLMVSTLLVLRGDVKETYKVLLVAQVVTGP